MWILTEAANSFNRTVQLDLRDAIVVTNSGLPTAKLFPYVDYLIKIEVQLAEIHHIDTLNDKMYLSGVTTPSLC